MLSPCLPLQAAPSISMMSLWLVASVQFCKVNIMTIVEPQGLCNLAVTAGSMCDGSSNKVFLFGFLWDLSRDGHSGRHQTSKCPPYFRHADNLVSKGDAIP